MNPWSYRRAPEREAEPVVKPKPTLKQRKARAGLFAAHSGAALLASILTAAFMHQAPWFQWCLVVLVFVTAASIAHLVYLDVWGSDA